MNYAEYTTRAQALEMLGVCNSKLLKFVYAGKLKKYEENGRVYYNKKEIQELCNNKTIQEQ